MPLRRLTPLVAVAAWFSVAPVHADDTTLKTAVPLTVPRKQAPPDKGPLDKVEVSVWIPDGVKVVKGAIVNPHHLNHTGQKHWQEAARLWEFALIGADYFEVADKDYPTLQAALKELAGTSKHPELENVPLCFFGFSAGAGMAAKFAELMPERTVAVAPVGLDVGPTSAATRKIPTLTIVGEKDGKQVQQLTEKFAAQRKDGALWAIAVQWDRGHDFGAANNLLIPFFEDVIRRRAPIDKKLLDLTERDGWIGYISSWGRPYPSIQLGSEFYGDKGATGDKGSVSWFPSRKVAAVWRAFVADGKEVKITEPVGFGEGMDFAAHPAGKAIHVAVTTGGLAKITKVELFDADKLVKSDAKATTFEVTLEPGVHTLVVLVTADGRPYLSRPQTIVVRK
jgi:hypothetical protein